MVSLYPQNLFLDDIYCKSCQNQDNMRYDYHEGTVVCISCGAIAVKRFIDFTAEYNLFADSSDCTVDPRRAGGEVNENLLDSGLGTYLDIKTHMKAYRFYNRNTDIRHREGIRMLKTWGDLLGIEHGLINMAIGNLEQLINKKDIVKNTEELAAAVLFMTARAEKRFFNIADLEKISGKSKKNIKKCFWLIRRSFNSKNSGDNSMKPSFFAKVFADRLNLPGVLIEKIGKIGEKFENAGILEGKNPKNIASVIIYNESNCSEENRKSFKEISEISEISDCTIRKTYENLIRKLEGLDIQIEKMESFEKVLQDLEKLEL